MILFGSTFSPFVRKTAAFCSEKGIDFELKPVVFQDPDPDFRIASPFGKMPGMKDGDYHLADSSAIIHYLEAKHPDPALIPSDPQERGRAIWFDEFADTLLMACGGKMFFNRIVAPRFLGREGNLDVADTAEREEMPPLMDYLESQMSDSGFLVGGRLTIADLAVCTPFGNFRHMGMTLDAGRWPKLAAYTDAILSRPSFADPLAKESAFLDRMAG